MPIPSRLLTMTGTVQRPTRTPDGQGGRTTTYPDHGTIRCRVWPASATERAVAGKLPGVLTHQGMTVAAADIQRNDRLVIGAETYTVLFVTDPSVRDHHRQLRLERLQEGA